MTGYRRRLAMRCARGIKTFLLFLAFGFLAGCYGLLYPSAATYRLTTDMPPENVTTIEVEGAEPWVIVGNRGPGTLEVTFGEEPEGSRRLIGAGGAVETALGGTRVVRLETGSEGAVEARIEARRARGVRLSGPRPIDATGRAVGGTADGTRDDS